MQLQKWKAVQFSPLTDWVAGGGGGEHEGLFSRDHLSVFSAGGPCELFWHGQVCPLFDVVHPAFPLRTTHRPPCKVPQRMVLERLSWRVMCPNRASVRLLTVARRGSCGPTRKLILLHTQSLVSCSKQEIRRSFVMHLVSKALILFSESASRVMFHNRSGGWK